MRMFRKDKSLSRIDRETRLLPEWLAKQTRIDRNPQWVNVVWIHRQKCGHVLRPAVLDALPGNRLEPNARGMRTARPSRLVSKSLRHIVESLRHIVEVVQWAKRRKVVDCADSED